MSKPDLRLERLHAAEQARRAEWLAAMSGFDPARAHLLKQDGSTAVYRGELLGRQVVLKRWDLADLSARLKSLLRAGRPYRHWRAAAWLTAHGIPTARCLALVTDRSATPPHQWLVMEALPGKTVLQHMADNDLTIRQQHAVARALGNQAAALMRHKRHNRDPKPSNQIVTALTDRTATVAVIDCVGISRNTAFDSDEPVPMLARMVIEAIGVGLPPRRSLLMRVLQEYSDSFITSQGGTAIEPHRRRAVRNQTWRDIAEFIRLHGDPTPRVNPLAPPP